MPKTPVFLETYGSALIDAARITAGTARMFFPEEDAPVIQIPGQDPPLTVQLCLEQAMNWLDAAREASLDNAQAPPSSLHVVGAVNRQSEIVNPKSPEASRA